MVAGCGVCGLSELDEMKKMSREMEEEAAALREMQAKLEKEMGAVQVERWSAAARASCDLETDNLLTSLRLLKSYFSKEQLQTGVLQFFEENLPNVAIVEKGEYGYFEVERKVKVGNSSMNQYYGVENMSAYYLHQMSSFTGLEFISKAAKANALCADNLQINDYVNSQRLPIGTAPNTIRLPKHGEMLLSVRGSPLGVYNKQDNMEAINESEED